MSYLTVITMAVRKQALLLLLLSIIVACRADSDLLKDAKEKHIIAYTDEKLVIPCIPTSSYANVTLLKGEYSYRSRQLYVGRQPFRNQTLTYDITVGFTLAPVSDIDSGTYRCRAETWRKIEYQAFTVDISTDHLFKRPEFPYVFTQRYNQAVIPCIPVRDGITVSLYRQSYTYSLVKTGVTTDSYGKNQTVSYNSNEGFTLKPVTYSDDTSYKCVATSDSGKDTMYYYVHVDQVHHLYGIKQHYIFGYEGDEAVIPCRPTSRDVEVELYRLNSRKLTVGKSRFCDRTLEYDATKGFILAAATTEESGEYKCNAQLGMDRESINIYLYINPQPQLLTKIPNRYIDADTHKTAVFPCIPSNRTIQVKMYEEVYSGTMREVTLGSSSYRTRLVTYDPGSGFTMSSVSYSDTGRFTCVAQYNNVNESLDFYLRGRIGLFLDTSHVVVADEGGKAVIPCRPNTYDSDVILYKGRNSWSQREIHMGKQPTYNQTVTYNAREGFTFDAVYRENFGWYKCRTTVWSDSDILEIYLDVHTVPKIIFTNLNSSQRIEKKPGETMDLICNSTGSPFPTTVWSKNDVEVTADASVELLNRNQTLRIKAMSDTYEGNYRCKVTNRLGEVTVKGELTVTDQGPTSIASNLDKNKSITANLNEPIKIYCRSHGKPKPEITWFRDGEPLQTDTNMVLQEENQVLKINVMTVDLIGNYSCKVQNALGTLEAEGNIIVPGTQPAEITDTNLKADQSLEAKYGTSFSLICKSRGNPVPKTSWFKNNNPITASEVIELKERDQTLVIKSAKLEDKGTYSCEVKNELNTVKASGSLSITGAVGPKMTDTNLNGDQSLLAVVGGNLTLFCNSEGQPPPQTFWFKDKETEPLNAGSRIQLTNNNQTLLLTNITREDKGMYSCKIKNDLEMVQAEGDVNVTDPITILETNLINSTVLKADTGSSLTVFCKSEGHPPPKINWFKDGKRIHNDSTVEFRDNNQTLVIKDVKEEDKGVYRCVVWNNITEMERFTSIEVEDDSGLSSAASVTITVICIIAVLSAVVAYVLYTRRERLMVAFQRYMQLSKPEEDINENSDFSERLQEEYLHRQPSELVRSECPPGISQPARPYSDDDNARVSNVEDNFTSLAHERIVEMRNLH
ncbi:hemicentin-1-like isoform X2 [Periplaneta americana]|uniref:hemicentin-1-like isoform X2 n=1 Tax=Periplaneta americana TaxID=6978 RepID=UPI0037E88171